MTAAHSTIADAFLHEPKGAAGASVDTVYVSDGGGSGTWQAPPQYVVVTGTIADLSTADTIYLPAGVTGTLYKVYTALGAAIATADATVSVSINGTPVTNGSVTVAYSGSAAGDIDSATPTANNTMTAGDKIAIATDGASTNTAEVYVQLVIKMNFS